VNPRRWLVLVAMTGSLSMIMLDQTVVSVALPSMARELPLTPHGQQWVVNAYVLALAALVALGGRAADLLGRVRAFQIGVTLFFLASAGCAVAWDTTSIIGFRALQGAGAALMVPVSATIVLAVFPEGERGRVMAIYAGISQVFLALGPLVGGLLTEYVTWRAVFLLNVPVGLATLALVAVAKIENRPVAGARIAVATPRWSSRAWPWSPSACSSSRPGGRSRSCCWPRASGWSPGSWRGSSAPPIR
jgi:MFS family permease